eukprot:1142500-Pelagomonas_calceolata.AAC.2
MLALPVMDMQMLLQNIKQTNPTLAGQTLGSNTQVPVEIHFLVSQGGKRDHNASTSTANPKTTELPNL